MRDELYIQETGAAGWAEVAVPDCPARVLVKIAGREDGRYGITRLVVVGNVDSSVLKSISMARIEAMINRAGIGNALSTQDPKQWGQIAQFMQLFPAEFQDFDDGLTAYLSKQEKPSLPPITPPDRQPLGRPDGSDPDAFYQKVAEAYEEVVRQTAKPAKVLAEESGVPVATVHRWIHETRRRGFLPPARKGRAG